MEELIYEYENILIGRIEDFTLECFDGVESGGHNEKLALSCIKYALEQIMGWDESTAIQRFDTYILNSLKLKTLLRFIDFPPDLEIGNPRYILSLLYPKRIEISTKQLVITTFQEIIDEKRKQFPRDYFFGNDGFKRYCYCLKYLLEVYKPFNDIEEIYKFFLSAQGNKFLDTYKLKTPAYQYDINILNVIREITKNSADSELYYELYSFNKECKKIGI